MALLIYISCEGEARQVLNQLEISEIQGERGLQRVLRLLEDAFGSRADERFEQKQEAYLSYRRTPGTSIAAYIVNLRRLREEYLKEDEGTVISDRAFAQRMLSRAALTRRERYDVFFSAGGKYVSQHIEKGAARQMLRHPRSGEATVSKAEDCNRKLRIQKALRKAAEPAVCEEDRPP